MRSISFGVGELTLVTEGATTAGEQAAGLLGLVLILSIFCVPRVPTITARVLALSLALTAPPEEYCGRETVMSGSVCAIFNPHCRAELANVAIPLALGEQLLALRTMFALEVPPRRSASLSAPARYQLRRRRRHLSFSAGACPCSWNSNPRLGSVVALFASLI